MASGAQLVPKRRSPDVFQIGDLGIDRAFTVDHDAQLCAFDVTENGERTVASRGYFLDRTARAFLKTDDNTRRRFAEQKTVFGKCAFEINVGANRRGVESREAAFGQSNAQTSVRTIVSRVEQAGLGGFETRRLHRNLSLEIDLRHSTVRNHLVGCQAQHRGCVFTDRKVIVSFAQQRDYVTFVLETGLNDTVHVFDQADHADHRRRQNAAAFGLVIKRNVAGHNRRIQRAASLCQAIDDLRKRPHHLRSFGRSKIQTVGDSQRSGANANDVASGLGHDEPGAGAGIRRAITTIAIERHGQRAPRFFDAHHRRVSAGQHRRVGAHHVIVLAINPLFGSEVGEASSFRNAKSGVGSLESGLSLYLVVDSRLPTPDSALVFCIGLS